MESDENGSMMSRNEMIVFAIMEEYLRQVDLWCEHLDISAHDVALFCFRVVISELNWSVNEDGIGEAVIDCLCYRDKVISSISLTDDKRYLIRLYNLDSENTLAHKFYGRRSS